MILPSEFYLNTAAALFSDVLCRIRSTKKGYALTASLEHVGKVVVIEIHSSAKSAAEH